MSELLESTGVPRKSMLWASLALMIITLLAYLPAGESQFVDYDDGAYVTQNAVIQGGLSADNLRWAFTQTHSSNWHPLTWISHMLDCELFGLNPRGHHLMAVGLHAFSAGLCGLALMLLTRRFWPSLLVGLFFGLHPQRVESVAWISERKDVLSGVFFFLCLCAYALYVRKGGWLPYAWLLLCLALGLLAKQMLVTLPCLLLVLDHWPLRRFESHGLKRCLLEKIPLLILVVAAGLATVYAQGAGGAIASLERLPMADRVANAIWSTVAYMGQMFWPAKLAFFYPHPYLVQGAEYSTWSLAVLLSAALMLAISVIVIRTRRSSPWLLTGWLWYLGLLAPVVGIVHVGAQSMADRYAYLTTIGLYIAIIWSMAEGVRNHKALRTLCLTGVALALGMIPVTRAQIATWKTSPALFEHAIRTTQRNYVAHSNYGYYLHKRDQKDAAEKHYLKAIEYAPNFVDSHSNLGAIYIDRKQWEPARRELQLALDLNPEFIDALMLLGLLEESRQDPQAALRVYGRAVAAKPGYILAANSQARVARQLGSPDQALRILQAAQARGLNSPELWMELGAARVAKGQGDGASNAYRTGLNHFPAHIPLRVEAAYFYASHREPDLRDSLFASKLLAGLEAEKDWKTLRARASASACSGDFSRARKLALDAMVSAPVEQRPALKEAYERYKQDQLDLQ